MGESDETAAATPSTTVRVSKSMCLRTTEVSVALPPYYVNAAPLTPNITFRY